MESGKPLEEYLSNRVDTIVKSILNASLQNPKASMFMVKYAVNSKKARAKRKAAEIVGEHIPPFLIASITEQCNLHCTGCYARANQSCKDLSGQREPDGILTEAHWNHIFTQAEELGIAFILLAGGEPFIRKDVLLQAGSHSGILFPVFTNGTMMDEDYMTLLERNRNLMPVISIEGNQDTTDARWGKGIYQRLEDSMEQLRKKGILFGASITVTKQNMREVLADDFVRKLEVAGVKAVIYVEYVPVERGTQALAPDDRTRDEMRNRLDLLRAAVTTMVFIAFPGDEKMSGGCLAAGRGFFHINARGGAEPCPFSPYSDTNVIHTSLKETLRSPLFCRLQANENLMQEHTGGCTLFEQKEQVESMLGVYEA